MDADRTSFMAANVFHTPTSEETAVPSTGIRSAKPNAKVLIVDDDHAMASGFRAILIGFGYDVVAMAPSGNEAIRVAKEKRPDVVLMDIVLEGEMSGIEAANEIKSLYNMPVIFLTSYVDDEILRRAKITDPFGYLLKPCQPRELFATIELALSRHDDLMRREAMEEELRRSKEELAVILRGVAEGITVIDAKGSLVYANDTAARLIGVGSAHELLGLQMTDLLGRFELEQEDGKVFPIENLPSRRVLKGEAQASATIRYVVRGTGEEHWSLVHSNPVFDQQGHVRLVITVFHDITERRHAEEHLQHEYAFRRAIEDSVPSGIATVDLDGVQTYVNQAFCRMVGWTEQELVGASAPFVYWPPEETNAVSVAFKRMLEGSIVEKGFELQFQRRDGGRFHVFVAVTPLKNSEGGIEGWLISATDINERKLAQQQLEQAHVVLERRVKERTSELALANEELLKRDLRLREYAGSVQRAQEEERQRIARELHDDLCQQLSGMKLAVEAMSDEANSKDKGLSRSLQHFNKQLEEMIIDVRRISANLRPAVLDDFGLVTALGLLVRDFERLHKIPVTLDTDGSTRLLIEPQLEIALYRIAQEALSNVAKHGQASSVTVALHKNDVGVVLRINDNGKGFNPAEPVARKDPSSGIGLMSMRERTELLGGDFAVESRPGGGTVITVTIPLHTIERHEENTLIDRG